MRPPAEQVIRDYLNRLSVAARNRLPAEDRSAFLARTRDYVERQSGVRDMTDPADVMRALNDYGEPEALVERERARLEARRSERERAAAASKPSFWKPRPRGGAPGPDGDDDGAPASPYSEPDQERRAPGGRRDQEARQPPDLVPLAARRAAEASEDPPGPRPSARAS